MRTLIVFAAALLMGFSLEAQISLRPQAGFNTSSLSQDFDDATFSDEVGFQFGVDLQLGNRFYVQPGIFWESAKNELRERIDGDKTEFTVNRIRVPLLVGYKLFSHETNRWVDLRLFTGPNMAFSVGKNIEDSPLINKGDFKDAVYGWQVGAGLDLAIFFVDAGYTFGLSEVFEGMASDVRNNLFYANAGVRIGF